MESNIKNTPQQQEESDPRFTDPRLGFGKSSRLQRSPVATAAVKSVEETPKTTMAETEAVGIQAPMAMSPRQEYILKLRAEEEDAILKCRQALRRIKAAVAKQKSISLDVRSGVSDLDELLDVLGHCRNSWKKLEADASKHTAAKNSVETVGTPTLQKRQATSPLESESGKKLCERQPSLWQKVTKKGGSQRKPEKTVSAPVEKPKPKAVGKSSQREVKKTPQTEAVLIKPEAGQSYVDVLRNIRSTIQQDEKTNVRGIRKTRAGALLVELNRGEKLQPELVEKLKATVKETATVAELKPTATVEIRDLDSLTVEAEVAEAVRQVLANPVLDLRIKVTAPNSREQVRAFVTLESQLAETLLKSGNIKIGFVRARMRICQSIRRCYRCFGVGHLQINCTGPDRNGGGLCIRCGEVGHKLKDCKKPAKCCICSDLGRSPVDHLPGSQKCPAARQATTRC